MSAETQAERTRAVPLACTYCGGALTINMETVGPAYLTYEQPESIECADCDGTWEPDGTTRDLPRWLRYPDLHDPPDSARALAEQAQTTDTLTDDERGRSAEVVCTNCDADDLGCTACGAHGTLASRSAGDRDAHQVLARVRAVITDIAGQADYFDQRSIAQHARPLRLIEHDLRHALGDADDQHDGSGT